MKNVEVFNALQERREQARSVSVIPARGSPEDHRYSRTSLHLFKVSNPPRSRQAPRTQSVGLSARIDFMDSCRSLPRLI